MSRPDLSEMRAEYASTGLDESDAGSDPFALFDRWLMEATAAGLSEPNAMALATATAVGVPSVRIVLLKGITSRGAIFFTNYESQKGLDLAENPRAAAVLLWHDLGRQVRFEGGVSRLSAQESDDYFDSRPAGSRVSAIASPQSRAIADRGVLEERWREAQTGEERRPEFWGGYLIEISAWEFWQGRLDRLHDRIRFELVDGEWQRVRLAP